MNAIVAVETHKSVFNRDIMRYNKQIIDCYYIQRSKKKNHNCVWDFFH